MQSIIRGNWCGVRDTGHEAHGREEEAAKKRKVNTDKMRNKLAAKKKPLIIID